MPPVNRAQFRDMARRLNQPGGGFSVQLKTGHEPSTGIMVSQQGTEKRFLPGEHVGGREVAAHGIAHQRAFGRPENYQGGWHDDTNGHRTLDVSQRFPQTRKDEAVKSMWANDQDGAYDLDRGDTIHNFAKRGTAGTTLGKYLEEPPVPRAEYDELRRGAAQALRRGSGGGSTRPPQR